MIADRFQEVRRRIAMATAKSGRNAADVTLVVVTKTRSVEEIKAAVACGATDIGENYVQEAVQKFSEIGKSVRWHIIGHLQRNKVKAVLEFADLIHGVDSIELAREISRRGDLFGRCVDVLVEIKLTDEPSKFGLDEPGAAKLVAACSEMSGLRVCGLMGMAPVVDDSEKSRPFFRRLKQMWDKLPEEQRLYLSMGMTQDYEIAIEEGANMVRIGAAIFAPRA